MGDSYFWKPFAQGVATPIVLIGGTNLLLKDFKVSNPYLYWGGLAASSAVVVGILADKIKVPILNAESDNCPICKGDIYGDMSMIGEEIVPDICGDCDIYVMPQGSDFKVRCIECGYGDIYGSRTPCEECESIADKMEAVNYSAESYEADSNNCFICSKPATKQRGFSNRHGDDGDGTSPRITDESGSVWFCNEHDNLYDFGLFATGNLLTWTHPNGTKYVQGRLLKDAESFSADSDYDMLMEDYRGMEDYVQKMWNFIDNKIGYTYFISDDDTEEVKRFRKDLSEHMGEKYIEQEFNAESFGERDSANMRELRKILERELPILVQQINKIEKQLKSLERGIPIEYPIENIRDNLDNMTEVIGEIHLQKIDYLSRYEAEEGEPCPNCKCSHENLKMIDSYNDGGTFWINMVCQDCGLEGGSYTDEVQWEDEGILQASPQIAYNMGNPNFGALKCPRCFERFEKAAESFSAETFNSDSHTDSFMAEMPVNAVKNEHGEGWTIDSVHRRDYKETFKNWKPSKYPYEKRITQDSVNENCNSCGKDKVHYQFYLPRTNSVNPKIRFIDSATYCQYDPNTCGGNICRDCADNNDSCENCGAEICSFCEEENNYEHSDLVCVDCREFNESLEDD